MQALHDLRCAACDAVEFDVSIDHRDYPATPACSTCGGDTKRTLEFWQGRVQLQVKLFAARNYGNGIVAQTKQEDDRLLATAKERYPNDTFYVEHRTRQQAQQNADEIRHAARQNRLSMGLDDAAIATQREMRKAASSEAARAAAGRNEDPNAAAQQAANGVVSAADLVGSAAATGSAAPKLASKASVVSYTPAQVHEA